MMTSCAHCSGAITVLCVKMFFFEPSFFQYWLGISLVLVNQDCKLCQYIQNLEGLILQHNIWLKLDILLDIHDTVLT